MRKDVSEGITLELCQGYVLILCLHVETWWYSIFEIACKSVSVLAIINALASGVPKIGGTDTIRCGVWRGKNDTRLYSVGRKCENAQSCSSYMSLSESMLQLQSLVKSCSRVVDGNSDILFLISVLMLKNSPEYESLLETAAPLVAKFIAPCDLSNLLLNISLLVHFANRKQWYRKTKSQIQSVKWVVLLVHISFLGWSKTNNDYHLAV